MLHQLSTRVSNLVNFEMSWFSAINSFDGFLCHQQLDQYGCKSKCEVRINPQNPQAIQTPDPDLRSRPIQTSRSRPIQTSRSRPMIQTPLFYVGWKFSFSKYWKVLLCTTKCYSSTTLYYKVLLCTTKYDAGWSREVWKNLAILSFQTVPDQFHGIQGQCPFTAMLPRRQTVCASSAESFDSV